MSANRQHKGPSQRQLRVGEQIKHIVAETIQRGSFHDERIVDMPQITVTEVRASPDLKNATAYVVAHNWEDMNLLLEALNAQAKNFQKEINNQSNLKFTPRLHFKKDKTFDNASRIESLLDDITYSDQEE